MSGFTMIVLEDSTERLRPPKSETLAPLMANTGCLEPSNLSACKRNTRHRQVSLAGRTETVFIGNKAVNSRVNVISVHGILYKTDLTHENLLRDTSKLSPLSSSRGKERFPT